MTEAGPRLLEVAGSSQWRAALEDGAMEGARIVGIEAVLADLDRKAVQPLRLPVRAASYGFRWDWRDMGDTEWWPQGIATSGEATASGRVEGRPVVAVSWYAKRVGDAPSRGTRVSIVDVGDPTAPRYTHVLLVEADFGGESPAAEWKPVRIHAGGVAWYERDLFVADTRRGLRVFSLDDLVRVDAEVGGCRYVLPQRYSYRQDETPDAEPFRFSFLSVDRSTAEHALVAGEYGAAPATRPTRLCRYRLDPATSTVQVQADATGDRWAVPEPLDAGVAKMQGAVTIGETTFVSTSRGRFRRGSLWTRGAKGDFGEHKAVLAIGPEDLSYWPQRDQIWSVSEYPGRFPRRRFVYAMPRTAFDPPDESS